MNHTLYSAAPRSEPNVGLVVLVLGAIALAVGVLANAAGNGGTGVGSTPKWVGRLGRENVQPIP